MMNESQRPTFTFLGHATVRCDLPTGEVLLIDPWVAGNPVCPAANQTFDRIDAMLITHGHFDHMADAVSLAKQHQPKTVVGTVELCAWLDGKGVKNCSAMNIGGSQDVLGLRVTQVQAIHTSGISDGRKIVYGGVPSGYVVRLPGGFTFYHAGDTALFGDMRLIQELYQPQLGFVPIGDHFTMDPRQAAMACQFLGLAQVVPIHWGTFPMLTGTPDQLRQELATLGYECEVIELSPGQKC
jgi:L-ascorbate metabolism protein UlaG (beta-lactamase superfamily)